MLYGLYIVFFQAEIEREYLMLVFHWTVNVSSMKVFIPEDFIVLGGLFHPGESTVLNESVLSDFTGFGRRNTDCFKIFSL